MPSPGTKDVSVIIPAHNEGELAHHTLNSARLAMARAQERGISTELIVVLDRPARSTRDYFATYGSEAHIFEVDFGDAGPARNFGVQHARGRYVSFLDADDLFCRDWLWRAFLAAEQSSTEAVFNPLYGIMFDHDHQIIRFMSTANQAFRYENLLEIDPWCPSFLAPRSVMLAHPFQDCSRESGFGYEDWHWYCEVVAANIPVTIVDETVWFYRRRIWSRWRDHRDRETIFRPARVFDWEFLKDKVRPTPAPARPLRGRVQGWLKPWAKRFLPHELRTALRAFQTRLQRLPTSNSGDELPGWLIDAWKDAHQVEPKLFPTQATLKSIPRCNYEGMESPAGRAYVDLCSRLSGPLSHVILVPSLRRGGAETEILHYVRALVEQGWENGIAVIATDQLHSPWASRLPSSVAFIEFAALYPHLDQRSLRRLLAQFLIQKQPQVTQVLYSSLGFALVQKHGPALAQYTNLYAHAFGTYQTAEGQLTGHEVRSLPEIVPFLTAVLSDHKTELDRLCKIFPFPRQKWQAHYQPVAVRPPVTLAPRTPGKTHLDVLWASRLDRQKRLDLLASIADRCRDKAMRFHVWGTSAVESDRQPVPKACNIVYHGGFDGFQILPVQEYDAFLYTSQFDGLPNVLLEAMAAGLPVVASDVGGVAELVNADTGFLITPHDDVDRYVEALLSIHERRVDVEGLVRNAFQLLQSRHSWESFVRCVRETPGYIVTPEQHRESLAA